MFCIISFFFLPIKTRFLYLFVSSTVKVANMANYIKHDLDNLNFSSTTIVIPLFSWTTSVVHIFRLRLYDYSCTHQVPSSSHIHTYSYLYLILIESRYREISKFVIWFHGRNVRSSWDFYLELSGIIWANMSLRSGSNASSFS